MSTETHTPGPWVLWGKADPSQCIAAENGPFVAQTLGGNDAANARLIAAAPALLAALRDMVDVMTGRMDGETVALHNALAALRSATGAA